ncbi:Lysine-specific permease [Paraburkholderia caffeinitolerans]|uniref:Lysine-specific permease n=1 Tax=Paraburkholderia caffeinitolerans TaxID=1723730 RepID=A0A6J5FE91_9BURK|nr:MULTISPECIES: amino acid permease [Paraburkholderia]CAB3778180.1 Lysine-specific permease [Paraburkholderia caffeinitolerans]
MRSQPDNHSPGTSGSRSGEPILHRGLQARHLRMIAIGGSIGTGLFVATGTSISQAGPGGAMLAYMVIGLMVYFLMTSLGEMAAFMPVSGSFAAYGAKFVDEGFGFAIGWNYWYSWAVTIAVELVAAQLVMHYWFPKVPGVWWSALFLTLIFALNALSVRGFGEAEYWFSLVKVLTVIAFIAVGVLMIFGIMQGGPSNGFENFTIKDAPFVGGWASMLGVAMIAGFSFQGTEMIGVAAGEAENPSTTIPRAVKQIFWRILLFYVLAIFVIGMIIPYTDPSLLKSDVTDIGVSPFTLVFRHAGLAFAAGVMNAVILTAVLSAGNSGMYASTRMLYNLAVEGRAPKLFAKVSAGGVPLNALFATTAVGALCFLTSLYGDQTMYLWLLNLSGMAGFITWLGIAISHYRFRKGFLKQGYRLEQLPYRAKLFPFGPILAAVLCTLVTVGQDYQAFLANKIDWAGVSATYIGLPLFLAVWFGYAIVRKSRLVRYEDMEFAPWVERYAKSQLETASSESRSGYMSAQAKVAPEA